MRHALPDGAVLQGHVLDALAGLLAESVHMCVTSPPYWGLRKYNGEQVTQWADGEWAYGMEDTPERWADHTVEWLRAVRRVLRKDGTVWLNVGDSYSGANSRGNPSTASAKQLSNVGTGFMMGKELITPTGYKPLDLIHTPSLLIPRLLADGWFLRSVIVWAKPNPMPESVSGTRWERHRVKQRNNGRGREAARNTTEGRPQQDHDGQYFAGDAEWGDCPGCARCTPNDGLVLRRGSWRPTRASEWILMLAKSANYFSDGEGVRQPLADSSWGRYDHAITSNEQYDPARHKNTNGVQSPMEVLTRAAAGVLAKGSANLRNVWIFPTQSFADAHFATYPTEFAKRCILAGTSDAGCCATCGAPWARVVKQQAITAHDGTTDSAYQQGTNANRLALLRQAARERGDEYSPGSQTLGFRPTCQHSSEPVPSTVLDPFLGSGTSAVVVRSLARRFVGIELSADYVRMALERLEQTQPGMVLA